MLCQKVSQTNLSTHAAARACRDVALGKMGQRMSIAAAHTASSEISKRRMRRGLCTAECNIPVALIGSKHRERKAQTGRSGRAVEGTKGIEQRAGSSVSKWAIPSYQVGDVDDA